MNLRTQGLYVSLHGERMEERTGGGGDGNENSEILTNINHQKLKIPQKEG